MAEFTHDAAPHPRTPPLDGLIIAILAGTDEQGAGCPPVRDGRAPRDNWFSQGSADIIEGYSQPGDHRRYGPSEFLGEIGMLTGQRAFLSAVATSAGRVLAVPVTQLRGVMAQEPRLSDLILRTFTQVGIGDGTSPGTPAVRCPGAGGRWLAPRQVSRARSGGQGSPPARRSVPAAHGRGRGARRSARLSAKSRSPHGSGGRAYAGTFRSEERRVGKECVP